MALAASVVVVPASPTACVNEVEVLLAKFVLPPKLAVTTWLPADRVDVEQCAVPLVSETAEQAVLPSIWNVTLPAGVAGLLVFETVAVNVTCWPTVDGFTLVANVVEVVAYVPVVTLTE